MAGRLPVDIAADEDFWFQIQRAFTLDRTHINLNNGGVRPRRASCRMPCAATRVRTRPRPTTCGASWNREVEAVRRRLAAIFGCDPEEMAITRNASEALEICQLGLDLKPGDEILTTNQDYPRMITTWAARRREASSSSRSHFRCRSRTSNELCQRFEQAITPRTKVILFCHITNLTGQIFPVKRICQMGRQRGIEAIVDGAHGSPTSLSSRRIWTVTTTEPACTNG